MIKCINKQLVGIIVAILALIVAIVALHPTQWINRLSAWIGLLNFTDINWLNILFISVIFSLALWLYRLKQIVRVWTTRKEWWDNKLPKIIEKCEKLILITSYESTKHPFWTALQKRFQEEKEFHFIMLMLAEDNPFMKYCTDVTGAPSNAVTEADKKAITDLINIRNNSSYSANKTIEYGYWEGISQGPMLIWTVKDREVIATGFWQQIPGSTDLSPWLVTRGGPVYKSLKGHYELLINKIRQKKGIIS